MNQNIKRVIIISSLGAACMMPAAIIGYMNRLEVFAPAETLRFGLNNLRMPVMEEKSNSQIITVPEVIVRGIDSHVPAQVILRKPVMEKEPRVPECWNHQSLNGGVVRVCE